jgi:hypothetical protein
LAAFVKRSVYAGHSKKTGIDQTCTGPARPISEQWNAADKWKPCMGVSEQFIALILIGRRWHTHDMTLQGKGFTHSEVMPATG